MAEVWVVQVQVEYEDAEVYGPYTQSQAQRLASRLEDEVRLSTTGTGVSVHPRGVVGASAFPLTRYDGLLSGTERRQARREARMEG